MSFTQLKLPDPKMSDDRSRIHTILVICWHVFVDETTYTPLGPDYVARNDNEDRRRRHLVAQLEQFGYLGYLGYTVELTPAA